MRNLRYAILITVACVLLPCIASAMPWSWDMFTQPSHKAQEGPAPPVPEGIVSVKGKPYYADNREAAAGLQNPYEPTPESIERGRIGYTTYCATCHGATGKGEGLVGQKYVSPTDLVGEYVQSKPDGDIFYTITNGGLAIMPAYADSVDVKDRWHIVNYIKHALIKQGDGAGM